MSAKRVTFTATAIVAIVGLAMVGNVSAADADTPSQRSPVLEARTDSGGPKIYKQFWSSILRLFITFSRHAILRMVQRGVSQATVQRVLNEGKVIYRANGVIKVTRGGVTVTANAKTGTVITVTVSSGGGGV